MITVSGSNSAKNIWGKVVLYLKERKFVALHVACGDITDVKIEGETLVVDTDKMTAYVVDENGETLRNGLPYLQELNFPTLAVGDNTVTVEVNNATLTELQIQAKSRWR